MKLKAICYICSSKINISNTLICNECFNNLTQFYWTYCSRCGCIQCYGCENLNEFSNIFNVFNYSYGLPELLVQAKDHHDLNAQYMFHHLFYNVVLEKLKNIMENYVYDYVLLPPLRKERILNSQWHPIIFLEDIINTILKSNNLNYNPKILNPVFNLSSYRQAYIPSKIRLLSLNKFSHKKYVKIFGDFNLRNDKHKVKRVLLLDDVLTTGKSLKIVKEKLEDNIEADVWDIFTIFRALQSVV